MVMDICIVTCIKYTFSFKKQTKGKEGYLYEKNRILVVNHLYSIVAIG
jgi:hypothetical protein